DAEGEGGLDGVALVRRDDGALLLDQTAANVVNARITRDTKVDGDGPELSARARLTLQRVQAHYIIARAMMAEGRPENAIKPLIRRAEADLASVPESFGRWLRAEIASLRAERLSAASRKDEAIAELRGA